MAEKEIEITIAPDGKVTAKTIGVKGEACMDYADLLVQLLGQEQEREKTSEYYESQTQETHVHIHQRRT